MAENVNGNGGIDIPAHPSPSSIGEIKWPPVPANENRAKGLHTVYLESPYRVIETVDQFAAVPFGPEVTRVTGRIFIDRSLLLDRRAHQALLPFVEGAVFLEGCGIPEVENGAMLYLGRNHPDRKQSPEIYSQEIARAAEIFGQLPVLAAHSTDGYTFVRVTDAMRQDADIQAQFFGLYKAFQWDEEQVVQMLMNQNNLLMAAFHESQLVSAGMAERASVPLVVDGTTIPFSMFEITEAATRVDHRKKGLYTRVALELMRHLGHTDINLLYGESNSQAPGVLKAARNLGRSSSLDTLHELGFPPRLLEQHVTIDDANGHPEKPLDKSKNDLLPTYMSRTQIFQFLSAYG